MFGTPVERWLGHVWGMSRTCLGHAWDVSGTCSGPFGNTSGTCLGHVGDICRMVSNMFWNKHTVDMFITYFGHVPVMCGTFYCIVCLAVHDLGK